MADVVLRIEANPNAGEEFLGKITNYDSPTNATNSNISNTSISANDTGLYVEQDSYGTGEGSNGLTWAFDYLVFNKNDYLDNVENSSGYVESETKPTQFFWGIVPTNKEYYLKLVFSNATKLKDIMIKGDELSGQFPTRAVIDGTTEISNDDYNWAISFENESDTHTIEFTHWNRANYNATISKISITRQYLEINKFNGLKSVETLSQLSSDSKNIIYGVIPSRGSAEIIDIDNELYEMAINNVIPYSDLGVKIICNGNSIHSHITSSSNYSQSKILTFEFYDFLSKQDISFEGLLYNLLGTSYPSLYYIVKYIFSNIINPITNVFFMDSEIDEMLSEKIQYKYFSNYVEKTIKDYFQEIRIEYPYLLSSSYREAIDKICNITQTVFFMDDNGKCKFVSARPIMLSGTKILRIPKKQQLSVPTKDVFITNKFDGIKTTINKLTPNNNYEVYTSSQIYCYEDKNLIVNDADKNSEKTEYDILGTNLVCQINYNLDISSTQNIIMSHAETAKIKIDLHYNVYKENVSTGETIEELQSESISKYLENTTRDIPYHSDLDNSLYANKVDFIDFSFKSTDNNIRANIAIKTGENMGGYYLMKYVDYFNFTAYKNVLKQSEIEYNFGGENKYELPSNELLQEGTVIGYKGDKLVDFISENIISDYKNGLISASITISCGDIYDINGMLVKDWSKGQICQVGDIICIDKDNEGNSLWNYANGLPMYWKIVGRNFRKNGVPLIDLELQEVKQI